MNLVATDIMSDIQQDNGSAIAFLLSFFLKAIRLPIPPGRYVDFHLDYYILHYVV